MRPSCPRCGLRLEREQGYFLGAMALNLVVAELLFVVAFATTLVLTWPRPPWVFLTYGSAVGVVLFPIILYPFSRTVWIALDLLFHPVEQHERQGEPDSPADLSRPGA